MKLIPYRNLEYKPFIGIDNIFHDFFIDKGSYSPPIEIKTDEKGMDIKVELPGINIEDIDIEVNPDNLIIKAERKTVNDGVYHSELTYGKFTRYIKLPFSVKRDNVSATYKDGILYINLLKAIEQSIKIKIT